MSKSVIIDKSSFLDYSRASVINKVHVKAVIFHLDGRHKQIDQTDFIVGADGLLEAEKFGLVSIFSGDEFHTTKYENQPF